MNDAQLQKVGVFAAETMAHLSRDNPPDAKIENVMIIVAISKKDEDGRPLTGVEYACTDPKAYIQRGLVEEARDAVQMGSRGDMDSEVED